MNNIKMMKVESNAVECSGFDRNNGVSKVIYSALFSAFSLKLVDGVILGYENHVAALFIFMFTSVLGFYAQRSVMNTRNDENKLWDIMSTIVISTLINLALFSIVQRFIPGSDALGFISGKYSTQFIVVVEIVTLLMLAYTISKCLMYIKNVIWPLIKWTEEWAEAQNKK